MGCMMAIASLVVEIQQGTSETVLHGLAQLPNVSVYGMKENQIVTVVEGDTIQSVDDAVKILLTMENVTGVFPVYAGDYA
jgi:nitrate reductase NapAB chaperone NapD